MYSAEEEAMKHGDLLLKKLVRDRDIYFFVVPGILFYFVFRYMPLYFVQVAFKDYRITRSIWDSSWVGLKHFVALFKSVGFIQALRNTFIISFYFILFGFPVPIALAILLNEIRNNRFKRVTQTIMYLPHFISWAVIGGIVYSLLSEDVGLVNNLLRYLGRAKPIPFLSSKSGFRAILVVSNIWKNAGWGTIIYLAAITKIDPQLYEAAIIDGAGRFQRIWHITLPGIRDVVVILLILRIGNLLNVGFEQMLVLVNAMVLSVGDVLDVYVWRTGLVNARYGYAAAAGLFKSVISAVLIYGADRSAKRLGDRGLF